MRSDEKSGLGRYFSGWLKGDPLNYNLYIIVASFLPCVRGDFNRGLPALKGAIV